jgi:hypothetical protein
MVVLATPAPVPKVEISVAFVRIVKLVLAAIVEIIQ